MSICRKIANSRSLVQRINRVSSQRCLSTTQSSATTTSAPEPICQKLGIVGGGRMAEAFLRGITLRNVQPCHRVTVYDVNSERTKYLTSKYNCEVASSAAQVFNECDVVILAIKPQHVGIVGDKIKSPPKGLLISIMAGVTIKKLIEKFKTSNVIRSMPNTPAMVLQGMTVWNAAPDATPAMIAQARALLGSFGDQIEVSDENYLDMATAVSGSGPAYVFLVMEAMIDAAVHLGFPRDTAHRLVFATVSGSAAYASQSKDSLSTLRNNVTSPGGTTAAGIYQLEKGGFRTVIADAVWAAYKRSKELGSN